MGAAIGGALLGGAGAIIGGLSGSSRTNDRVKKVALRVSTDDLDHPNYDILFLAASNNSKGVEKTEPAYQEAIRNAAAWHSRIAAILKRLSEDEAGQELTVIERQSISVADEIEKLAQLRDEGILTDREFTAQKDRLLAN